MKKTLLLLSLFVAGTFGVKAQCTITPGCTVTNGYCSTPAAGSSLPNAFVLVAYSTVIQISIGTTVGPATINSATLTSISGLPTGLSYSTNPTNGVIMGGSNGCVLIAGTPASGSAGTYTVTANVTVNTNLGSSPTTLIWTLTVAASSGISQLNSNSGNMAIIPNPVVSNMTINADFQFLTARVLDGQGNLALSQSAMGASSTSIDVTKLNSGIYFLQLSDGIKVVTRKFIKE